MKTLLIAINSRNLHTNLAVRYLYICCREKDLNVEIYEGNINTHTEELLSQIYRQNIDTYCFSTYIWNIAEILKIAGSLRKLNPQAKIVFGGPEATFRHEEFRSSSIADFVLRGDGERLLPNVLKYIEETNSLKCISAEKTDIGNLPFSLEPISQVSADEIPFPYDETWNLLPAKDQLLYYETSRGCPYSCTYCLSSSMYPVTYRSLDKVFQELHFFMDRKVPLVKFVDRTWNGNRSRAKDIIRFILDHPSDTSFHFEAAGDLFDSELLELMKKLPIGTVQLEIGVQSSNLAALESACRVTDLDKLRSNVLEIISWGNIHVHLDLIAGLPFENFNSFGHSFDFVFQMKSQMLQLGFLKLLNGSKLKTIAPQHEILYNDFPPYEVLSTKDLTYEELLTLKDIEEVLEHFYNSGRNRFSMDYIIQQLKISPFQFFMNFTAFLREAGYFQRKQAPRETFAFLYHYAMELSWDGLPCNIFNRSVSDLLKYDWIVSGINSPVPDFMKTHENQSIKQLLQNNPLLNPKECSWVVLSSFTVSYVMKNTSILLQYMNYLSGFKKTDGLLLVFNSTKGKKTEPTLLTAIILPTENTSITQ